MSGAGQRLLSLDVFRGMTVVLMIVVNNPGSWGHIHPPLRHAAWHGLTPTDLVFPFFLFIMGVSVSLAFARHREAGKAALWPKTVRRTALIFALGLLLNGFPFGLFGPLGMAESFSGWRIMGVLQRIALCYLLTAGVAIHWRGARGQATVALGLILLYELLMRLPLVAGHGGFGLEGNLPRLVDLKIFGEAHIWRVGDVPFDPEGLLTTLNAAVTSLLGLMTGEALRARPGLGARLRLLTGGGLVLSALGGLLALLEPLNKQLWTTSYTILTGGLALLAVALCVWMVDGRGWVRGLGFWRVFGRNPLVAFLGSGLLARLLVMWRFPVSGGGSMSVKGWIYTEICRPLLGPINGSLLFALLLVLVWWAILWGMDRRGWHLKV